MNATFNVIICKGGFKSCKRENPYMTETTDPITPYNPFWVRYFREKEKEGDLFHKPGKGRGWVLGKH